eukprot:TRINITY_DN31561_c0_g1_i1.p1 TRINITY_DN31561_c0_g1~~TRINITY_DN31561_c0_g1_i1.p1  ORF type:complete len:359 (-),score=65.42 TRINITY_DN31561_c0_g1_i1:50-1126(-)
MGTPKRGCATRRWCAQQRRSLLRQVRQAQLLAEQARCLSVAAARCGRTLEAVGRRSRRQQHRPVRTTQGTTPAQTAASTLCEECAETLPQAQDELISFVAVDRSIADRPCAADRSAADRSLFDCQVGLDDFWALAFGAGLRSSDVTWMEDFERHCSSGGEAGGHLLAGGFVQLIMDDLARHCRQTGESLQDLFRLARVPSQFCASCQEHVGNHRSNCKREVGACEAPEVAPSFSTQRCPVLNMWPEERENEGVEVGENKEMNNNNGNNEQSINEANSMDECPKICNLAAEGSAMSMDDFEKSCVDEFEKTCALVQRLSKEQVSSKPKPQAFDPLVPEYAPVFNPSTTDWEVALRHVFS